MDLIKIVGDTVKEVGGDVLNVTGKVIKIGGKVVGIVNDKILFNTLDILNPTDYIVKYAKYYISSMLLDDQVPTYDQMVRNNIHFSIAQLLLTPFERSRFLIQTQHIISHIKTPYLGAMDSFFKILRDLGYRSLFRGTMPGVIYNSYIFNFMDYRQKSLITSYLQDKSKKNTIFTLGYLFLFDLCHITILHPIELIWTRRSCDTRMKIDHNSFVKELYYLITQKGVSSLFTGYSYSSSSIFTNYVIFSSYLLYNSFKLEDVLDIYIDITLAIVSIEFLLHPLDTIKRRKIIQCHDSVGINKYSNFKQTIRLIYQEEHIVGFYKGCLLKFILNLGRRLLFYISCNYTF